MTLAVWARATGCVLVVAALAAAVARRKLVVVNVFGVSMHPGLVPGDRVLVRRGRRGLTVGTVVVLRSPPEPPEPPGHPGVPAPQQPLGAIKPLGPMAPHGPQAKAYRESRKPWVIKRVSALPGHPVPEAVRDAAHGAAIVPDGAMVVLSDNQGGIDSRRWGFVPVGDVLGPVVWKLPGRTGQAAGANRAEGQSGRAAPLRML